MDESAAALANAFGVENRLRIIRGHLDSREQISAREAWKAVYRLLLWINPTIGLAHCYESDKCQPHRAWYARSLAFHAWVANELNTTPGELWRQIDHMFREALPLLVGVETGVRQHQAEMRLEPYAETDMPRPGEDPDLVAIVRSVLGEASVPEVLESELVERLYGHFAQENKRKNLLGRGFEDALSEIIGRLPALADWTVMTRPPLRDVHGFGRPGAGTKEAEPDLALVHQKTGRRVLVTAKWSFRADRERQFDSDFEDYVKANEGQPFEHVLLTNEFDAARLNHVCTTVKSNTYLFTQVVHVQPAGLLAAFGLNPTGPSDGQLLELPAKPQRGGRGTLLGHLDRNRLVSLETWLDGLVPG